MKARTPGPVAQPRKAYREYCVTTSYLLALKKKFGIASLSSSLIQCKKKIGPLSGKLCWELDVDLNADLKAEGGNGAKREAP